MGINDRVAVRRTGWEGRVTEMRDSRVRVAFDNGGSGIFRQVDVVSIEPQNKAWPPPNIETKELGP